MRIRPLLLFAPTVMAGGLLLAAPAAVMAANGMTETGASTYEVVPGKNQIQVTVQISIANNKPNEPTTGGYYYYFWNYTEIDVEADAGTVTATSDGGGVSVSTVSSDANFKVLRLDYPNVYYGQTRVVTAKYTIAGAPQSPGGFRAGQAYASLCAIGNGDDTGSVSVVVPDGYDLSVVNGNQVTRADDSGGKQVFSSGSQTGPRSFWTCVEARNPANLAHSTLTAAGQAFDIQAWPEDAGWNSSVRQDIGADVPALEDLTGLQMPGGTIVVAEVGSGQLNDQGVSFNSTTTSVSVPEAAGSALVAHALSHVWFNGALLADTWMAEGLAGYAEQAAGAADYTPCGQPGAYPGTGSPNLKAWLTLSNASTTQEQDVSSWQHAAACYVFTSLAAAIGPAEFKAVLAAATADDIAYVGASPGEKLAGAKLPLTAQQMLDLLDERGMVPAGIADLDQAQKLLAGYGIFDAAELAARSNARATYHALVTEARSWKLPLAIRSPMSAWDFETANTAMATAREIVQTRDSIAKQLAGFSLDGTEIQKRFESAATQVDLDGLLALIKKEAGAAATLDQATKLKGAGRSLLQSIGLIGTNLDTPLDQARTDLQSVDPDRASAEAQSVLDRINDSSDQGLLRTVIVAGSTVILLVLILLIALLRRRRRRVAAPFGPRAGYPFATYPPPMGQWPPAPQPPAGQWTPPPESAAIPYAAPKADPGPPAGPTE